MWAPSTTTLAGLRVIAVRQEAAAIDRQVIEARIVGGAAHDARIGEAGVVADLAADLAHRHRVLDHRQVRHDAAVVVPQQPVLDEERAARLAAFVRRLDACE